ncbi:MAG: hypothetical protein AAGJ10_16660 [Bacteroidota bacterium]
MVSNGKDRKSDVRTRLNVHPANADDPIDQQAFATFVKALGNWWGILFQRVFKALSWARHSSSAKRYAEANLTDADAEYRLAEARLLEQKHKATLEEAARMADMQREQRVFERERVKAEDARQAGVEARKMIRAVMDTPGSVMSKDLQLEQLKHTYPALAAKIEEMQGYLHDLRVTHGGDMRLIFPDQPKAIDVSATEADTATPEAEG